MKAPSVIASPVAFMRLRKLESIERPPSPEKYLLVEQKYDGFKVLAVRDKSGDVRLYSRRGKDITHAAPAVVSKLMSILTPGDAVLGEMIYVVDGKQSLTSVQQILGSKSSARAKERTLAQGGQMHFVVYDLLAKAGRDATNRSLKHRRFYLGEMIPRQGIVYLAPSGIWEHRKKIAAQSVATGGEGIVVKDTRSPYMYRSTDDTEPFGQQWKYKPAEKEKTTDVILTGYKKEKSQLSFQAVQRKGSRDVPVGKISNLSLMVQDVLKRRIDQGERPVVEARYQEMTKSGKLRHAGFVRMRDDKPESSVTVENPSPFAIVVFAETPHTLTVLDRFEGIDAPVQAMVSRRISQERMPNATIKTMPEQDFMDTVRVAHTLGKRITLDPPPPHSPPTQNPRPSVVKRSIQREALLYDNFDDFARAYWEGCSTGTYWVATNKKRFTIDDSVKRKVAQGRFFLSCTPDLAFKNSIDKRKRYVAEVSTLAMPKGSIVTKRGAKYNQIKVVSAPENLFVYRVVDKKKAMSAYAWAKSILPTNRNELVEFYEKAHALDEKRREQLRKLSTKRQLRDERAKARSEYLAKQRSERAEREQRDFDLRVERARKASEKKRAKIRVKKSS